ncbi:MAG TPA: 2-C-methyl-D-erythritol 2,4-cyclodiphosphate synthase [Ignavibacteriaceae bacterium]|nr:2-C-methyl-D-erythritol 2,4-cyclodiphosphate synthase [Ignavibacteriaceae bacterium]
MNPEFKTGIGIDVHSFAENRKLILGGVEIPFEKGLEGHSDADVLLHAVCDALLGALALGDIGNYFPDTDPKYKNADSTLFLRKVSELLIKKGYNVSNIDSVITAQKPKLSPYIRKMRERIAEILKIDIMQVSVKATTTEHLGFVGREEGIAAFAVVLISENTRHD